MQGSGIKLININNKFISNKKTFTDHNTYNSHNLQPIQQKNKKDISRFIDIDRINIYRNNEKQNYNNRNQVNRHPQGLYVNDIKFKLYIMYFIYILNL